jgi:hypothetical protein
MYGPLVLAAEMGPGPVGEPLRIGGYEPAPAPKDLPAAAEAPRVVTGGKMDWMEVVSAEGLTFRTVGQKTPQTVKALCGIKDEKYAVYWKTEKKV